MRRMSLKRSIELLEYAQQISSQAKRQAGKLPAGQHMLEQDLFAAINLNYIETVQSCSSTQAHGRVITTRLTLSALYANPPFLKTVTWALLIE